MTKSTLVLGGGYVGVRLAEQLNATCTHRTKAKCLADDVQFDLSNADTWENLPAAETVIWTFPATPLSAVKAFYNKVLSHCSTLIVYASSSCYQTQGEDDIVTETSPLDLDRKRVEGEEWLRAQGATVLVLSGIYGPNREPKSWLERGKITTPDKRVNLIHLNDIVNITDKIIHSEKPTTSERFNLADGESLHWKTIAEHYQIPITPSGKAYESKRVNNKKITDWLDGYQFHPLLGSNEATG